MDPATPNTEFSSLPLSPALLQALGQLKYERMTPIQQAALPAMLAGRDLIGQAPTGTGKTAAYGLAVLSRIDPALRAVQALVLCPTRELADQIAKEIRRLARCLPNVKLTVLSGGIVTRPQVASLAHDPPIVVGMAGRVQELIDEGSLKLDDLKVLVLDEADRMLGADFDQATRAIVATTPKDRQTLLFSATFPEAVRAAGRKVTRKAEEVTVGAAAAGPDVVQSFFEVEDRARLDALAHLLSTRRPESALVFCHTRGDVEEVEEGLRRRGYSVLALHGHVDQRDREEMLVRFANGSCRVLVATDIAARGLDIKGLAAVISYELPKSPDAHLHRVGRTGRAGTSGLAWHLFAEAERDRLEAIGAELGTPPRVEALPPKLAPDKPMPARYATLCVDAGRVDKLRPGDLLGALTGDAGFAKEAVGAINTYDTRTYFAIEAKQAQKALERLGQGRIKGKKFRVRMIG